MAKAVEKLKNLTGIFVLCILVLFHQQMTEKMAYELNRTNPSAETENVVSFHLSEKREEKKTAYLTFDDGPSANTDKILDILKEKGVKATFFVVGKEGEQARQRYRRIVKEGHSLGMHSYSHRYEEIYANLSNYKKDLLKLQDYLYDVTGEKSRIYRFPGGSSNRVAGISLEECIRFLKEEGIEYYDWNASSEDAVHTKAECSALNQNILKDALSHKNTMILMHDLSVCTETVEGLSELIDRLLEEGYELRAIDEDTVPIHHRQGK